MVLMHYSFLFLILFLFSCESLKKKDISYVSSPELESYTSMSLQIKDYDEMQALIQSFVEASKSHAEMDPHMALHELKKGLKVSLMRPDFKSSLIRPLKSEIIQYKGFLDVFDEVVQESVAEFQEERGSVAYQASLIYLMENSIAYLQAIKNKESGKSLAHIRDAKIKVSVKISNYLALEMGRARSDSPSKLAEQILVGWAFDKKKIDEEKKKALEEASANKEAPVSPPPDETETREPGSKKVIEIDLTDE